MAEYIKREEAINAVLSCFGVEDSIFSDATVMAIGFKLKDIPTADVQPVVRGHWIGTKEAEDMGDIMKEFTCSICGCCEWDCTESESFNFCPNCGADMRGE